VIIQEGCFVVWEPGENQYHCHRCRLYWGHNEPDPPKCLINVSTAILTEDVTKLTHITMIARGHRPCTKTKVQQDEINQRGIAKLREVLK